ncbi:MAG: zinc ribbon domain-containing protein [Clostridia bacterium]|nr:zinc ribbon domain-containing protein [Clostridia bacterium]
MRYCGNCGKPVNSNADYCLNCGCFLNKSSFNCHFCTNCGNPVYPNADICVNCGSAIKKQNVLERQSVNSEFDELLDIGLIIVSILFPLIGFIVGAIKKVDDPIKAARYTKAATISLGVEIAIVLIIGLFLFVISEM